MKTYIREICFGFLWVSLMTGCASYPHKTLSLDTHLVQVTRRVQRAVVKITTYDADNKRMGMGTLSTPLNGLWKSIPKYPTHIIT